jgi:Nucleoside 2-deoxyribosyltransferase
MKLYLAGPMFTPAERDHIDALADRLDAAGHDCFVPHRQKFTPLDPETVFAVDSAGLRDAEAVVAWLDGPMVDDGTACEIGIFTELVRNDPERHRGIIGLATDWRIWRSREAGAADHGINFFVGGAILEHGLLAWSIDEVEDTLREWAAPPAP